MLRQQHGTAARRGKNSRKAAKEAAKRKKQPRSGKGFNCCGAKLSLQCADSRFGKPRKFPTKGTSLFFLRRAKRTKKHARGLRTSGLRGRFKALPEKILAEFSNGTSRTRFFAQNGGEKALNRCEVPVLQREDLEQTVKEWPCSLVDSRLWLGANLRC